MKKKYLVLSPHVDDAVLFCGGTISKLIESGNTVYVACFSYSKKSIPDNFDRFSTEKEFIESCNIIGVKSKNRCIYDFPTREFNTHRQHVLDILIDLRREIKPDCVLLPCSGDTHQDHQVIHMEGVRAFKNYCDILGYEAAHNIIQQPMLSCFVSLKNRHIQKKKQSWCCFKSQIAKKSFDYIDSIVHVRGAQINKKYAEAFEPIRINYEL